MSELQLLTIRQGAQCLFDGGVIAYPTEAVYGLGCDPDNREAVFRILELKSRPASAGTRMRSIPSRSRAVRVSLHVAASRPSWSRLQYSPTERTLPRRSPPQLLTAEGPSPA